MLDGFRFGEQLSSVLPRRNVVAQYRRPCLACMKSSAQARETSSALVFRISIRPECCILVAPFSRLGQVHNSPLVRNSVRCPRLCNVSLELAAESRSGQPMKAA